MSNLKVYIYLFLGMAVFGSATPVSKIVGEHIDILPGAALRIWIAALMLFPVLIWKWKDIKAFKKMDWLWMGLIALIGIIGFSYFMLKGMQQISGVAGSIIMSTTPALTAMASFLFFGDKMGWKKITAIGLAVTGIIVMNLNGKKGLSFDSNMLIGGGLVLLAVCCEVTYTLLGKKAADNVKPLLIAAITAVIAALLCIPVIVLLKSDFHLDNLNTEGWWSVAWWGAGTMALGSVLWYRGVKQAEGSVAAGFMGVMPVSALILSYILLDEKFQWLHLVGFALVFAGVVLISWSHAEMAKKEG